MIPNGNAVPNPCNENQTWLNVGLQNPQGGGDKNPFGIDFESADEEWTEELCKKDSDGDGMTNGQELGDMNCVWKRGDSPSQNTGISHP
ncbi:hypothetical protein CHS0354_025446, partial [Potamilus streckersoni]